MKFRAAQSRVGEKPSTNQANTEPLAFSRRVAQMAGRCTLLASIALGSGLTGSMLDSVEVEVGPHRAEVSLSASNFLTVDTGAPGAARIQSPDSRFGVDIELKEITSSKETSAGLPSFAELEGELSPAQLERFGALYADVSDDASEIKAALLQQFMKYSLLGGAASIAFWKTIGKRSWEQNSPAQKKLIFLTGALLMGSLQIPQESSDESSWIKTGDTFQNTPFQDMEVKGEVLRLAVPAIKQLIDFLDENEDFYDQVEENVSTLAKTRSFLPPEKEGVSTFVFVTDRHCNEGMNRAINRLADEISADLLIDTGDATFSGTEFEQRCFDDLSIDGDNIIALGNHDDDEYSRRQARSAGFLVLSGEIEQVGVYDFLGDTDPERTVFGSDSYQWRAETRLEMAERLTRVACSADQPPIVAVHDPAIGRVIIENGCSPTVFSGHTHKLGFEAFDQGSDNVGALLIGGTSGGAAEGRPTIGPLKNTATMTVGQLDEVGRLLSFRRVTVAQDASVKLGEFVIVNS